jgi:sec-independent protein translocase protein TatA
MINGLDFQIPANVNNPVVWIVALVLIMLLFGGQKLPELMRSLGRSTVEFKKGLNDKGDDELNKDKEREEEIRKRVEAEMRKEEETRAANAK